MKRFLFILFLVLSFSAIAFAQDVVALLQPIGVKTSTVPVNSMETNMVRAGLREGLDKAGFTVLTRIDQNAINKEIGFQQSGAVSDEQIKRMGEQYAAKYVCVSTITKHTGGQLLIEAYLVDVESGQQTNPASKYVKVINEDYSILLAPCAELVPQMLGEISGSSYSKGSSSYGSSSYGRPSVRQNFTESAYGINMQMIWVEGGSFLMGCTSEQGNDCDDDEKNVRRVTLDGFYIGMLEVTQSQWETVMGTSIYQQRTKAGYSGNPTIGVGSDYPMYYVSWNEAMEFCHLLSNKTGRTYTLPTEAQWEYAARGGTKADGTKYAGSNSIDAVAWYTDNSGSSTHRCGTKRANGLGIYDMSGNVREWCKDWYSSSYLSYDTNNPVGPSSGSDRVYRGGSWGSNARDCRVAIRYSNLPSIRGNTLGFRVVCIP